MSIFNKPEKRKSKTRTITNDLYGTSFARSIENSKPCALQELLNRNENQQKIIDLQDEIIKKQVKFDYEITAIIGHIDPEIYNNKKAIDMIYEECSKLNKELAPLIAKLKELRDE